MNIAALRAHIDSALQHEALHHALTRDIEARLDELHRAIRLPGEEPAATLLRFVHVYVGEVPDLLEAAASVADQAGLDAQVRPLLRLAEAFFLSPPALLDGHHGLEAILDEAYLAHRLVEEVNDRYILHFGQPLIPLDTTAANLVAHALIGYAFANRLDAAVQQACEVLLEARIFASDSAQRYREQLASPTLEAAWQRWPCLSRRLGVELRFTH